jgi:hypothetical protein
MSHDRAAMPGPGQPPEVLHQRIRARLVGTGASGFRTDDRIALALAVVPLLALAVSFIASELVYHRPAPGLGVEAGHSTRLVWTLALLVAMTFGATLLSFWRGRRGFGAGATSLAIVAIIIAPLYAALTIVDPVHVGDAPVAGVTISPWGARCALIAAGVGLLTLASFTIALRRAVPVASRLRGAAVGAAAGAWAGIAVFMFCPSADQQHLIAGHFLPLVALSLIGASVIPRWLRP